MNTDIYIYFKKLLSINNYLQNYIHFYLFNITSEATKVHMIFKNHVVLTWMHDEKKSSSMCHCRVTKNATFQYIHGT